MTLKALLAFQQILRYGVSQLTHCRLAFWKLPWHRQSSFRPTPLPDDRLTRVPYGNLTRTQLAIASAEHRQLSLLAASALFLE